MTKSYSNQIEAAKDKWEQNFRRFLKEEDCWQLPWLDVSSWEEVEEDIELERKVDAQIDFIQTVCDYQIKRQSGREDLKNVIRFLDNQYSFNHKHPGCLAYAIDFDFDDTCMVVNIDSFDDIDIYEVFMDIHELTITVRNLK